jgi:hypothetical protein
VNVAVFGGPDKAMHDCPACRVPLHGYEDVCPSCGTKQFARKGGSGRFDSFKPPEPGINWMPFILVFIVAVGVLAFALSGSWVGTLMTKGPPPEDPMDKMTVVEARTIIETELTKGLANAGGTGTLNWTDTAQGQPADKNVDAPVQLTIDATLPDKNLRTGIIDPIKPYMEKAKIPTLIMTDKTSHATWTYNVTPPAVQNPEE